MIKGFCLGQDRIALSHPPYLIAEISANHNGSIEKAFNLIALAKRAGANAVKIQSYTADTITIDCDSEEFVIHGGLWDGRKLYDLYKAAETPFEWHKPLFDYAKRVGITIFSSPFDSSAIELLESLSAPAYKIASFELVDHDLIAHAASTGKPLIISTGMATLDEIACALEVAKIAGADEVALLHCISSYPALTEDSNLNNIVALRDHFEVQVGLSDHTLTNTAAIASVALGATVIEKHFISSREDGGPDSQFSIEPEELKRLRVATHETWLATRSKTFNRPKSENLNKAFRRSLYFVNDLSAGDLITGGDVRSIRPGFGLHPGLKETVIGRTVTKDIKRGTPVSLDILAGVTGSS